MVKLTINQPHQYRRYVNGTRTSLFSVPLSKPYHISGLDRYAAPHLERVEKFARDLADRLAPVESTTANLNDEAFADLILTTFEAVARTRSDQK